MKSVSELFGEHVAELEARTLAGDEFATRSLCAMALLAEGWRYGDPDPVDTPPDGGGEIYDLANYRRAA